MTDENPYRYTAELAQEIETGWQDRWDETAAFAAPNPAGPWADPEAVASYDDSNPLVVLDMFHLELSGRR